MPKKLQTKDALTYLTAISNLTEKDGKFALSRINTLRGYSLFTTVGQNLELIERIGRGPDNKMLYRWKPSGKPDELHAKVLLDAYREYQKAHVIRKKTNGAGGDQTHAAHRESIRGQIEELNARVEQIEKMVQGLAEMIG